MSEYSMNRQEIADIQRWAVASSNQLFSSMVISGAVDKWSLDGAALMLWMVNHMDKPCSEWTRTVIGVYVFPNDTDAFIRDLAHISLGNGIICLRCPIGSHYNVYASESKDGSTNIDADVIGAFIRASKRGGQGC